MQSAHNIFSHDKSTVQISGSRRSAVKKRLSYNLVLKDYRIFTD
jgi:hypothetical protein